MKKNSEYFFFIIEITLLLIEQESKRIILAKKEDTDEKHGANPIQEQPKILLKVKDKVTRPVSVTTTPTISIATRENREHNTDQSRISSPIASKPVSTIQYPLNSTGGGHGGNNSTTTIFHKDSRELSAPIIADQPNIKIPTMKKPMALINDHYQLNTQPLEYLLETNANFFVIGFIGTQGVGKSTLLNILCTATNVDQLNEEALKNPEEYYFNKGDGIFTTKRTKEQIFSSAPTTEGIQMYITKDRTILLDCSPVLCNPYKKDYVINEIDDLKMIIFLMSVCNLLVVVQEDMMNINILRLLNCAEMMKPNFDRDAATGSTVTAATSSVSAGLKNSDGTVQQTKEFFPKVMFVKNMAVAHDFLSATTDRINRYYKYFFKQSKLKIYSSYSQQLDVVIDDEIGNIENVHSKKTVVPKYLNLFTFPMVQSKYNTHANCKKINNLNNNFFFRKCKPKNVHWASKHTFNDSTISSKNSNGSTNSISDFTNRYVSGKKLVTFSGQCMGFT